MLTLFHLQEDKSFSKKTAAGDSGQFGGKIPCTLNKAFRIQVPQPPRRNQFLVCMLPGHLARMLVNISW